MKNKQSFYVKKCLVLLLASFLLAFISARVALWHFNQNVGSSGENYDYLYLILLIPLVGGAVYSVRVFRVVPNFWKLVPLACAVLSLLAGAYILLMFAFSGPGW
jgi:hypothetical protein